MCAPRKTFRRLVVQRAQSSLRLFSAFPALNSEKHNTEDTKNHRAPRRNRPAALSRLSRIFSTRPSVLSVDFLCVLCVKFRKARPKMCAASKHFDGVVWRSQSSDQESCKAFPSLFLTRDASSAKGTSPQGLWKKCWGLPGARAYPHRRFPVPPLPEFLSAAGKHPGCRPGSQW
jgi:hypothetical protein